MELLEWLLWRLVPCALLVLFARQYWHSTGVSYQSLWSTSYWGRSASSLASRSAQKRFRNQTTEDESSDDRLQTNNQH